jgi:hypothetical protein
MAGMSQGPGSVSQDTGWTVTVPASAAASGPNTAGEHIVPGRASSTGSVSMP